MTKMKKSLTRPKKTERGSFLDFSTFCCKTRSQTIEGSLLGRIMVWGKISHNAEKTQRRDPLVSPSIVCYGEKEQAGTGPSRRHIQGSKIAKRLPSVKYSFTVVETRKFFENFFFEKITY